MAGNEIKYKIMGGEIICDNGKDSAEKVVSKESRPPVQYMLHNHGLFKPYQLLHAGMIVAEVFQLTIRTDNDKWIANFMSVPVELVRVVRLTGDTVRVRVDEIDARSYPGAFDGMVDEHLTANDWERRIYNWCCAASERCLEKLPEDGENDDADLGYKMLARAIALPDNRCKVFRIYAPGKQYYLTYKSASYNIAYWSAERDDALTYQRYGTCLRTVEWLKQKGYKDVVILNEAGDEVTEEPPTKWPKKKRKAKSNEDHARKSEG